MSRRRWVTRRGALLAVVALLALAGSTRVARAQPRFVAEWADGTRAGDTEIDDWNRLQSHPTLQGRALLDAKNPACWVCDTQLPTITAPAAYVEFDGGDRLPGRVVAYAVDSPGDGPLAMLRVAPNIDIDLPTARREQIGIRLDFVRRVVWQVSAVGAAPPGTLRLVDGRQIGFRSLRWNSSGVQVLSEEGPQQFQFGELAELHLPAADAWDAHERTLAIISPGLTSRLVRLDVVGGARITTSLARLQARSVRGSQPEHWFHLVQPAWAMEALAVAHRQISLRTFADSTEIPLSWCPPQLSRHSGELSSAWNQAQIDKNVQGGPLRAAGQAFGWGLGTHAPHELGFDLPASAKAFRTRLALDQVVAGGGCVRGRITIDEQTAFESPLLVGSERVVDSGRLPIAAGRTRRLVLQSDAAVGQGPPGSDPLDVRDALDWLEPVIEFDRDRLRRQVDLATPRALWGSDSWTVDALASGSWRAGNRFSEADHDHPRFRSVLELDTPLTVQGRLRVDPGSESAQLLLGQLPPAAGKTTFEIAVDGRRIALREIPLLGESGEPQPIVLSLAPYVGRQIEISLRFDPAGKPARLDWRGLVVSAAPMERTE